MAGFMIVWTSPIFLPPLVSTPPWKKPRIVFRSHNSNSSPLNRCQIGFSRQRATSQIIIYFSERAEERSRRRVKLRPSTVVTTTENVCYERADGQIPSLSCWNPCQSSYPQFSGVQN